MNPLPSHSPFQERLINLINIVLRAYGRRSRHGLDQEHLDFYEEGIFRVYKLTSHTDQKSIFVVNQKGRDVFVCGDLFNQRYHTGSWETWLHEKADGVSQPPPLATSKPVNPP
ncbi:MAG: hypothetical protein NW237_11415 [Cyanobacteriota bacterium]|nr:hypothetical protein [Cyanobacteriota bacterium]